MENYNLIENHDNVFFYYYIFFFAYSQYRESDVSDTPFVFIFPRIKEYLNRIISIEHEIDIEYGT